MTHDILQKSCKVLEAVSNHVDYSFVILGGGNTCSQINFAATLVIAIGNQAGPTKEVQAGRLCARMKMGCFLHQFPISWSAGWMLKMNLEHVMSNIVKLA